MRKTLALLVLLVSCSVLTAVPDIEFVDGQSPGGWDYDGADTFSFVQPINISNIQGTQVDALYGNFIHIPDLVLSSYSAFGSTTTATITPQGPLEIWTTSDQTGTKLLEAGFEGTGNFTAFFSGALMYPESDVVDLVVSGVNNTISSDLLNVINVNTQLELTLSLNHEDNFVDFMYQTPAQPAGNGFSGQINIVPEPMTIAIMGLGGLLIRRKKQ